MLSAAALLSLSGIAVSQAEEKPASSTTTTKTVEVKTTTTATNSSTANTAAASSTSAATSASSASAATSATATTAKDAPKVKEDPPQVKKLIALYPNLIARIQPQGRVCFEGQECDITIAAALGAADPAKPREGKMIYEGVCHTCHAAGLLGAPKFGDKGMWGPRIAKGKPTLYDHALHGFNSMPAKGGNADLLDQEVKNAVDYMVQNGS